MKTTGMYVLILLICSQAAAQADITPTYIARHTGIAPANIVWADTAQVDVLRAGRHALEAADSLMQAFRARQWADYLDLSYPGIVDYYGGKKGFLEYLRRSRSLTVDPEEQSLTIELVQLHHDDSEWQCVVRKTQATQIDNRPARVISYMVGQSTDEGRNWKYVDVAYNSTENLGYIMPGIFSALVIPQRQIVFLPDNVKIQ